jgi:rhamnosyltransferase
MTTISVLIPTYNAEKYLHKLIPALYSQALQQDMRLEIIVIDSSSSDRTLELLEESYPEVKHEVIKKNEFDHGATRNRLAALSTGDFLLYMTQDALPANERLIQNLLKPFFDPAVIVSYARQLPYPDANPIESFSRLFNYPEESIIKDKQVVPQLGIKAYFNSNACSMYRRSTFDELGGFPEGIVQNEDTIIAYRVISNGYKVSYTANALVFHSHNYGMKDKVKRYYDTGRAFKNMKFILENVSNEKEGFKYAALLFKHLRDSKKTHLVALAFMDLFIRFVAYKLGKNTGVAG